MSRGAKAAKLTAFDLGSYPRQVRDAFAGDYPDGRLNDLDLYLDALIHVDHLSASPLRPV